MWTQVAGWLKAVAPERIPAWLVIALVVVILALQGYAGLPAQVEENTHAIEEIRDDRETDSRNIAQSLCILKLQVEVGVDAVSPLEMERRCLE